MPDGCLPTGEGGGRGKGGRREGGREERKRKVYCQLTQGMIIHSTHKNEYNSPQVYMYMYMYVGKLDSK